MRLIACVFLPNWSYLMRTSLTLPFFPQAKYAAAYLLLDSTRYRQKSRWAASESWPASCRQQSMNLTIDGECPLWVESRPLHSSNLALCICRSIGDRAQAIARGSNLPPPGGGGLDGTHLGPRFPCLRPVTRQQALGGISGLCGALETVWFSPWNWPDCAPICALKRKMWWAV